MVDEGVIKFSADHDRSVLARREHGALACQLRAWREVMTKTQLVGQDPALYGGAGYGNISGRVGAPSAPRGKRSFLISGTQTGGLAQLDFDQFCLVRGYEIRLNRVESSGTILPSSESMTHGAIYDLSPHIRFVFHGHSPTIWGQARSLRLPTSDPSIGYGTPQMAEEVARLYRSTGLAEQRILAMGGHEDGVIVFGRSAAETGSTLMQTFTAAYAQRFPC